MSLPGAARALGLGDIRVDSALNEPLSAQIYIVGATRDELAALSASVANRETFQRYGADRPAFLSSATFKVGTDAQGRPVLNVRSAEAFSDPVVNFLVDLRWGRNEVVREYSLLLDPPGMDLARQAAESRVAAAPAMAPPAIAQSRAQRPTVSIAAAPAAIGGLIAQTAEPSAAADPPADHESGTTSRHRVEDRLPFGHTQHKIAAGETLRGIARRAGARSETSVQRMMIAMFRANPDAFEGNINRLRRGAVLHLPSAAELAALSGADAKREVRAQMLAWRMDGRTGAQPVVAAAPRTPVAPATGDPVAPPAAAPVVAAARTSRVAVSAPDLPPQADAPSAELAARVQSLEHELSDMHKQLAGESARIQDLKEAAARAEPASDSAAATPHAAAAVAVAAHAVAAPAVAPAAPTPHAAAVSNPTVASIAPQSMSGKLLLGPLAVAVGLLVGGFAYVRRRYRHRAAVQAAQVPEDLDATFIPPGAASVRPALDVASAPAPAPAPVRAAAAPLAPEVAAPEVELPGLDEDSTAELARQVHASLEDTSPDLDIDTELLERSYLDSLGLDSTLETVAVDTSDFDTGLANDELNTMVLDANSLHEPLMHDDAPTATGLDILATTAKLETPASANTELDYDLLNLDATVQHVQMPSALHDHPLISERRTNIVDVLKMALDRDPARRDLRMKLLETYYSAAATNQRSFLEVVRKLSREREQLTADDWNKVMKMGREIAAGDSLFLDESQDDKLANCA